MDIKQIRKQNFRELYSRFERNQEAKRVKATLVEFGKKYGLNNRHVSQIKNGTREIGDAIARRLEQQHNPPLPQGWMDVQHGPGVPKDQVEEQLVEIILTLYRQRPAEALRVIKELGKLTGGN
jgi:plasmid maintenance system antidote protein VapI